MTGVRDFLRRWMVDPPLVGAIFVLSVFGVAMIYSAGVLYVPSFVTGLWVRQAIWFGVALAGFALITRVPLRWFEWSAVPVYVLALLLLAVTLAIGTGAGTATGTRSWIQIGGLRFQPAEIAKIATVLMIARVLAGRGEAPRSFQELLVPGALAAAPLGLVMLQPDLGSALAFIGILFALLYWVGTPVGLLVLVATPVVSLIANVDTSVWIGFFLILGCFLFLYRHRLELWEMVVVLLVNLAGGAIGRPLWESLAQYQRNRLVVFLDPSVDPQGAGYHLIQSKIAIGSGGLTGKGFTQGTQKALDFLPEQHTDFIFSVIGEELGFVGTTFTLALFGFVLWRLVRLSEDAADPFAGLVVFGILGSWAVHIFINTGMTVGAVPITGIPLPFVSYGGTFLLTSWVALGVAVRLAHEE